MVGGGPFNLQPGKWTDGNHYAGSTDFQKTQ
jgi:hypothetical protein